MKKLLTLLMLTMLGIVGVNAQEGDVYTVVGGFNTEGNVENVLFGTQWAATLEANDMVKGADGLYTKTYKGVELPQCTIYYKVVKNHAWDTTWGFTATENNPDGNADYVVNEAGTYDVTFTFNPDAVLSNGFNVTCNLSNAVTFDFTNSGLHQAGESANDVSGNIFNETFTVDDVALQVVAGTAPSRVCFINASRDTCFVTYKGSVLEFTAPQGKAITGMEFVAAGTSNLKNMTASSGTINGMTWTGDAKAVRFTQGGTSYLATISVTLADATDATVELPAIEYVECANIAAYNALEDGTYAKLTLTDAEVTGISYDGWSSAYIQDATGGAMIQYSTLITKLQESTKLNGAVYVLKSTKMYEAPATPNSEFQSENIAEYTMIGGTIGEVNVAENLYRVVKFDNVKFEATSANVGTLTLGEETIKVNNSTNANQHLFKLSFQTGDVMEGIVMVGILGNNELLPLYVDKYFDPAGTYYTVAGVKALMGAEWDVKAYDNDMTQGEDGVYTLVKENVLLKAGNYEYKVAKNHAWEVSYPADFNATLSLNESGIYNVTFTFDEQNNNFVDAKAELLQSIEIIRTERYVGLGYSSSEGTVDFTAAKEYLGVEEVTTAMLNIVNPDGEMISSYAPYDGWFNGEGYAETWGSNTKVCVKFFEAIPEGTFSIFDMNGADELGKTYSVFWALKANDKSYIYQVDVTFVETPEVGDLTKSDLRIVTSVEYPTNCASYQEKVASLSDEQVASICEELGFESLSEATVYGYNPTTGELLNNYNGYDGWRNADGDFAYHSGNSTVPACVKYSDGQNYYCYSIAGCDIQTVKTYWAIANETKYVLVEIDFNYVEPVAIELTLTDLVIEASVTYNVNEPDYLARSIILTDEQMKAICDAIEVESFEADECYAYIYNAQDGSFEADNFDGWRDANGLGHSWSGNAEAPACVKFQYSNDIVCFNLNGMEPQTITTYWAVANTDTGKAALIKVNFIYQNEVDYFTVAGAFGDAANQGADPVFGSTWSAANTNNDMTLVEGSTYTLKLEDVTLEASGSIFYKVVANHNWNNKNWGFTATEENPDGNADYYVNLPEGALKGVYDVTFTFNPEAVLDNDFNVTCDVVLKKSIVKGDVNEDGEVGIGDIVAITNFMAGITTGDEAKAAADVNGDGEVGIGDIVAITNIMAGVSEQPAEEPAQE